MLDRRTNYLILLTVLGLSLSGIQAAQAQQPADAGFSSSQNQVQNQVQDLPDGNYRYWNGTPSSSMVSDQDLLANGGVIFTFRKQGNNIAGVFGYVDGEAVCVQGQVKGNTVSGISTQNLSGVRVLSAGEAFQSFGPSGYLQVRRGRQVSPDVVRYGSTMLDLNALNRINVGSQVSPSSC